MLDDPSHGILSCSSMTVHNTPNIIVRFMSRGKSQRQSGVHLGKRSRAFPILVLLTILAVSSLALLPLIQRMGGSGVKTISTTIPTMTTAGIDHIYDLSCMSNATYCSSAIMYVLSHQSSMDDFVPLTIASNSTGPAFGVFYDTGLQEYALLVSSDLSNWQVLNRRILPEGYIVSGEKGFAVTKRGIILISATRNVDLWEQSKRVNNETIFQASFDYGKTFNNVLNVTLTARARDGYEQRGFWHGVAETSNGTLFAGLYEPQGLVFKSVDLGRSWSLAFNASSQGMGWQRQIHDVEVDPAHNFVYVATHDETGCNCNASIWVSTDYGNNWNLLYSLSAGGAGIPAHHIPLTMGFINNGQTEYMILGLDDPTRKLYLLRVEPTGKLQGMTAVYAESSMDNFFAWWI